MLDVHGRLVQEWDVSNQSTAEIQLNVSPGFYLIQLYDKQSFLSRKILVQYRWGKFSIRLQRTWGQIKMLKISGYLSLTPELSGFFFSSLFYVFNPLRWLAVPKAHKKLSRPEKPAVAKEGLNIFYFLPITQSHDSGLSTQDYKKAAKMGSEKQKIKLMKTN